MAATARESTVLKSCYSTWLCSQGFSTVFCRIKNFNEPEGVFGQKFVIFLKDGVLIIFQQKFSIIENALAIGDRISLKPLANSQCYYNNNVHFEGVKIHLRPAS